MERFNLAIKWNNGTVKGISAFGYGIEAEREAYRFANLHSLIFGKDYEVVSERMLTAEELAQIQADWSQYDEQHAEIKAEWS